MNEGDPIVYKVVEISTVTDEFIERTLNEWTARGWYFQDIRFVMRHGVRRPALAFIFFIRPEQGG